MKLEDHVVSLELAKKLKELGVKQESLFYWADTRKEWKEFNQTNGKFIPFDDDSEIGLYFGIDSAKNASDGYNNSEPLSAFTVSELGELLPHEIKKPGADARAKMLIYLIEKSIITL